MTTARWPARRRRRPSTTRAVPPRDLPSLRPGTPPCCPTTSACATTRTSRCRPKPQPRWICCGQRGRSRGQLDPKDSAHYLGYFLASWNRLYHLYDKATDAFRAPYDRTVAPLYDGRHTDDVMDVAVQNSYLCRQRLTDLGAADVSLIDLGHPQHVESGKAGFAAALRWFGQIAPPTG